MDEYDRAGALKRRRRVKGEAESTQMKVGARLRISRRRRNWTLQELARLSGVSVSMLSQIECGVSTPSIKTLQRLSDVFGVPMSWFFSEPSAMAHEPRWIVRQEQRRVLKLTTNGVTKQLLSAEVGDGKIQLMLVHIEPNGSSGDTAYTHAGYDAGTVLEGSLRLEVDGQAGVLCAGDSFEFSSALPHRFENAGSTRCVVLWAVAPAFY